MQSTTVATSSQVRAEAARRRTFAVISHPDAGKSTLTEALALHARAIGEAGAVHGKSGRRSVVSDWMTMERARGISITSAALQFAYRDLVINLLDTPGHADFSEDTYRVVTAVDCAVMLLDAANGLEPQTLKLFEVCRHRRLPVITFINKWDRPGLEPLALLDDIERRTGLRPTPLTWPVGIAGEFHGVMQRDTGTMVRFERTPGGATVAAEEELTAAQAAHRFGDDWHRATEEVELRVCSGQFERGSVVTHAGTGRPFATKYAQQLFGRERGTADIAYPGDVIGLVNATALGIGDTLYSAQPVEFPRLPSFAPEHFAVIQTNDTSKFKRFRRGIAQLDAEGVVQVLRSDRRGDAAPVLAAVGPMQFEVATHRLATEFGVPIAVEHLPYEFARRTDPAGQDALRGAYGVEVLTRVRDEALLALFPNRWRLHSIQRDHPEVTLEPLLAETEQGTA